MPHVTVKMYPGKTDAEKTEMAEAIAAALMASAGTAERAISVSIEDVAQADWEAQVYRPEIVGRPETLFKKPGYTLP
ncbi:MULTISPECIES: tautomerase family protein [unclassified Methylobacterium]|uniref:tautomerase family protein n=1 Tax=unclassified Methylobacterium TaxID=2615210 RepID=UPI0006FD5EE8|nr:MULTISPECIES: tautomerase family protein [unclassified Methylobacterium]KQO68082.1 4-oxalocrotonate tautomerase [Methylobacterium sp. Leaf89]KQO69971.1 4-oxalocrotonate tautomerase [Methylobacterium sp. Leaf88]KQT76414.1 4-oxalocrotonate tautomerase [Methylobacterium sp. Leaf465]KQU27415.1 4-oxalocrotonate tautomerase [Methylobacterium sp. Leaf94]